MNYGFIISGTIGKEYDWWTGTKGTTAKAVKDYLDAHKDEVVDIAISSPGGYVSDGLTIGQYIKDHGKVNCHIMGMSASIATVLAMGASKVTMAVGSLMLIHQASTVVSEWTSANKDELDNIIAQWQKERKDLDTIDKVIASVYSAKNGKTLEENLEKMKAAAWLTPEEALEFGLIDEIRNDADDVKKSATLVKNFANSVNSRMGLPPFPQIVDESGEPTASFIEKTVNKLKSFFASTPAQNISKNMKTFVNICALLALTAMDVIDGKVSLTEEQATKVDSEIKRLQDALKTAEDGKKASDDAKADLQKLLDKAKADLVAANEQVKNLQKSSGADTVNGPAHEEQDDEPSATDMFNSIKDLI